MAGQQTLSEKSKQPLWMLLGSLVILLSIWLALIVNVPVLIVKHSPPSFAYDGRLNRVSMVLRLSGSHVWGTPVSDAFCIDLASGKLSRMAIKDHDEASKIDSVRRFKRSLWMAADSAIEVATYDPASNGELDIQRIDIPKGAAPSLIHRRYVLGADDANVYQWDAEHPQDGVRVFPSPLDERLAFNEIAETDLAYCLLQIEMVSSTDASTVESSTAASVPHDSRANPSDTERPSPKTSNKSRATNDPFGANPFDENPFDADPFGPRPFASPKSSQASLRFTRPLLLFRIDGPSGPMMISRWDVLSDRYGGFFDVVTRVGDKLVSIASDADAFEYRSIENGELIGTRPIPQGFDPLKADWAFDGGRFLAGSRLSGPLFDLATNDWLPNPGKGYVVRELWHEVDYGVYWSHADQRSSVFDHRRKLTLLEVPESKGIPEFMDAEKMAICSTRCGFGVDVVDLRNGTTLASWTPWWWVPYVLFPCLLASTWWIGNWMTAAASIHNHPLLDAGGFLCVTVALLTFRLKWTGISGIDASVFDEMLRGICCSALVLSCCGLFMGRGSVVKRVLVLLFVLAGVGAVMRYLFDATHEQQNAEGLLVPYLDYYDTVQAFCFLIIPALFSIVACCLLLIGGSRLNVAAEVASRPNRRVTWGIADLFLLLSVVAALLAVYMPLLPEARSELDNIRGNYFFSDYWKPLLAIGPMTVTVAIFTLARSRYVFFLAVLLSLGAALYACWEPISDFLLPRIVMYSDDPMRIAASSMAGAFLICLPYRLRGWRIANRYRLSSSTAPSGHNPTVAATTGGE